MHVNGMLMVYRYFLVPQRQCVHLHVCVVVYMRENDMCVCACMGLCVFKCMNTCICVCVWAWCLCVMVCGREVVYEDVGVLELCVCGWVFV